MFPPVRGTLLRSYAARGDHLDTSDYDIAIFGKSLSLMDQMLLREAIEDIRTLKKIDVVFVNADLNDEFLDNIKKEGVVIYE
ncbi:nucleotidyltransferase domain-containing protein [Fusibacter sp. 3D3]|uniref:nucleotidyltransferase domain-containing protein n=1 Tax=Fusibacter sp. 3D3 TaxID=1048380 RepID=UPI00085339A8|nr:nucleotidyltransferase domain-containing protein [Fusibacter sp. 3D3]